MGHLMRRDGHLMRRDGHLQTTDDQDCCCEGCCETNTDLTLTITDASCAAMCDCLIGKDMTLLANQVPGCGAEDPPDGCTGDTFFWDGSFGMNLGPCAPGVNLYFCLCCAEGTYYLSMRMTDMAGVCVPNNSQTWVATSASCDPFELVFDIEWSGGGNCSCGDCDLEITITI